MFDILSKLQNISPYVGALLIFCFRIVDVSLGTFRIQMIVSRKKLMAGIIGFVEVFIFILIISQVVRDVGNWINVFAYAGGYATGTIIGIIITERTSQEIISVEIISRKYWPEIEKRLREEKFGVTRNLGFGLEGELQVLRIISKRNYFPKIRDIALEYDPKAFITSNLIMGRSGGYIYNVKSKM